METSKMKKKTKLQTTKCNHPNSKAIQGSSMIEVLISIVILAIGLLGIAGMQTMGMTQNQSAYYRSQATLLANQYSDIIRSNLSQAAANKFGDVADDGTDWSTAAPGFSSTAACNTTTGCSDIQRAETDLIEWADQIQSLLPSGVATIERIGSIYHINISWIDDRADTDRDGSNTKLFTTSIRP